MCSETYSTTNKGAERYALFDVVQLLNALLGVVDGCDLAERH